MGFANMKRLGATYTYTAADVNSIWKAVAGSNAADAASLNYYLPKLNAGTIPWAQVVTNLKQYVTDNPSASSNPNASAPDPAAMSASASASDGSAKRSPLLPLGIGFVIGMLIKQR